MFTITNHLVTGQSSHELVIALTRMLLPHVLNSTPAEFASIVIDLVIDNYYPITRLLF